MSRYTKAEQEEAKTNLRQEFPAGSTVKLILSHVSRTGMSRTIRTLTAEDRDVSSWVARAVGLSWDSTFMGGVKISGCGMDMGFHLVDCLSYALYGAAIDQSRERLNEKGNGGLKMKWL